MASCAVLAASWSVLGTLSGDFQRQDRPRRAPSRARAALNASCEHFKAKVAKSVRLLVKIRI